MMAGRYGTRPANISERRHQAALRKSRRAAGWPIIRASAARSRPASTGRRAPSPWPGHAEIRAQQQAPSRVKRYSFPAPVGVMHLQNGVGKAAPRLTYSAKASIVTNNRRAPGGLFVLPPGDYPITRRQVTTTHCGTSIEPAPRHLKHSHRLSDRAGLVYKGLPRPRRAKSPSCLNLRARSPAASSCPQGARFARRSRHLAHHRTPDGRSAHSVRCSHQRPAPATPPNSPLSPYGHNFRRIPSRGISEFIGHRLTCFPSYAHTLAFRLHLPPQSELLQRTTTELNAGHSCPRRH